MDIREILQRNIIRSKKLLRSNNFGMFDGELFFLYHISIIVSDIVFDDDPKDEESIKKNIDIVLSGLAYIREEVDISVDLYFHIEFMIKQLNAIRKSKHCLTRLARVRSPISLSEQASIIKLTLLLRKDITPSIKHAKMTALIALIVPSRQIVGSCFASVVAINMQQHQIENFINIVISVIESGKISFTYGGDRVEAGIFNRAVIDYRYRYPIKWFVSDRESLIKSPIIRILVVLISGTRGNQEIEKKIMDFTEEIGPSIPDMTILDLLNSMDKFFYYNKSPKVEKETKRLFSRDLPVLGRKEGATAEAYVAAISRPQILQSIEFCLATLSEASGGRLLRNNMFVSLGIDYMDKDGLGGALWSHINNRVNVVNEELDYNISLYNQMEYSSYIRRRSGEPSPPRGSSILYESIKEMRARQNLLISLFDRAMQAISNSMRQMFVEAYNPSLVSEDEKHFASDIKAGFTLTFKGSVGGSSVYVIDNTDKFIDSVSKLLTLNEEDLISDIAGENIPAFIKEEVGYALEVMVRKIHEPDFAYSCFRRLANRNGLHFNENKPLESMESMLNSNLSPWSTPSGGTVVYLLKKIYNLNDLSEITVKNARSFDDIVNFWMNSGSSESESLIATSPTHVFRIFPNKIKKALGRSINLIGNRYRYSRSMCNKKFISFVGNYSHKDEDLVSKILLAEGTLRGLREKSIQMIGSNINAYVLASLEEHIFYIRQQISLSDIMRNVDEIYLHCKKNGVEIDIDEVRRKVRSALIEAKVESLSIVETSKIISSLFNVNVINVFYFLNRVFDGFFIEDDFVFGDSNWSMNKIIYLYNSFSGKKEVWSFNNSFSSGRPVLNWNNTNSIKNGRWGVFNRPNEYEKSLEVIRNTRSFERMDMRFKSGV